MRLKDPSQEQQLKLLGCAFVILILVLTMQMVHPHF